MLVAQCFVWTGNSARAAEPPPAKWRISCFAYRDIDRSGVYDMADRPYADLRVEMERPDGATIRQPSNIAGFANFSMELGDRANAAIYEPGTYKVRAIVPRGWQGLSDDIRQELQVARRQNAGSGMVVTVTCDPMGVAPVLTIGGKVKAAPDGDLSDIELTAAGSDGSSVEVSIGENGEYSLAARPGDWSLVFTDRKSGRTKTRNISIASYAAQLSATVFDPAEPPPLQRDVVTVDFDRLTTSDTLFEIPSGYGGINWKNWIATHHKFYQGGGYVNGTLSGEFIAYNSSGHPAYIWSDRPFDFVGTYISAAWPRGEDEPVTVKAWRGGKLAYEDTFFISNAGPVYFDAGYLGIDRLEFTHGNYERIVLDDFSFRR